MAVRGMLRVAFSLIPTDEGKSKSDLFFVLPRDETGETKFASVASVWHWLCIRDMSKALSPVAREGPLQPQRDLIVVVGFGGYCVFEIARGANLLLTGKGDLEPGGFVPVIVADGIDIFGVG